MDLQNNRHRIKSQKAKEKVLHQEVKKLLYRWMDQQQTSQALAREVQLNTAGFNNFKQESELNIQALKTKQTAKDLEIDVLKTQLHQAFQVFELERSALTALLLTERGDSRVLARELRRKDLEQRLSQALQEHQQYKLQNQELQDAQGKLAMQLQDQCEADKEAQAKALQRQQELADQLQFLQDQNSTLAQRLASLEDLEQRLSKALQERQQYKLQNEELQDAQGKLAMQLQDQCEADKEAQAKALERQQELADQLQILQDQNSTLAQQLASLEARQEREQYKLQCEELRDAQGRLTLQLEDQCKADKEAQEKALQRHQEQQDLAEQLQLLQDHNNTLAQQLARLQADKLAMEKALEQQDHKKKLQLQEDQSSSLAQQLASLKLEVAEAACKREKEVQDTWKLKTREQRSALEAAEKALIGIEKSSAPSRNAKALAPSSPPHPTSPHAPKIAPHLAPPPPRRRQGQATTAQLNYAFSGSSAPPRSEGPPTPPPPCPEGPPPPLPPRPRGAFNPQHLHGSATVPPRFPPMGSAGRMGFTPVALPPHMLLQQAGMWGTPHPAYRT
ncbi:hypothetical protein ABBQ38_003432 [Trebouxia sp. C0009 RCD-2024]